VVERARRVAPATAVTAGAYDPDVGVSEVRDVHEVTDPPFRLDRPTPPAVPGRPLYGLDIETDTTVDGLDPDRSSIVAVAVSGDGVDEVITGDESEVIAGVDQLLASLPDGVLITWNGTRFDLPFLATRAQRAGVPTGLRLGPPPPRGARRRRATSWHGHRHLDGLDLYRADVGRLLGLSCALKSLARLVGEPPVEVDRARIHELDAAELREYVLSDARLARSLVLRRWPTAASWVDPLPGRGD
jgi:DNA polymerase elongation subunit (family B)